MECLTSVPLVNSKAKIIPMQSDVMFHGLFSFSGWPGRPKTIKIKVHLEMICITKAIAIAKYLEDTSVYS